jgi:hypothetical protein
LKIHLIADLPFCVEGDLGALGLEVRICVDLKTLWFVTDDVVLVFWCLKGGRVCDHLEWVVAKNLIVIGEGSS